MFSFFKTNPINKLEKQYSILLEKAMHAQRNGDIRSYSNLTAEAEEVLKKIQILEAENV
ncbi:DUF6435 family protein [Shewanella sp. TC10]|uniref:DUF6435 family protein n=1 Tax=Shewanella sp. TC10 TaxID=1419739 RepID=UPI00129E1923|nr:DUF6435 family protein [Shewanella sp. TC10]